MTNFNILLVVLFLGGCGVDPNATKNNSAGATTANTTTTTTTNTLLATDLLVVGYVSPLNLTVDNVPYQDSEAFYTAELTKLTEQVHAKYPDYSLYIDAAVGLSDFQSGFNAFLVSVDDTGVASQASVDNTGKFIFNLPPNTNTTGRYLVSASKRLNLQLVKEGASADTTSTTASTTTNTSATITWCYNLTAQTQINLDDQSFILRKFVTNVTAYKCDVASTDISVPNNPYNYVVDAFTSADTYHGYGPLPASKTPAVTPVTTTGTAANTTSIGSTTSTDISANGGTSNTTSTN